MEFLSLLVVIVIGIVLLRFLGSFLKLIIGIGLIVLVIYLISSFINSAGTVYLTV